MKAPQRSKSLQIYMKPGIREDDLLLEVWDACAQFDRPQDVFRTLLRRGLRAMVETGDMPKAVLDACDLENRLNKRRGRARQEAAAPQQPYPYPPQPYPPQPHFHPYPQPGFGGYPPPVQSQPPMTHWPSVEGQDDTPAYDRGHAQHSQDHARPQSQPDRPTADYERRLVEDKTPAEPPRVQPSPAPDKRQEHPPPQPDPARPAASNATYGKGKKLGNLM